jgi:tetratricopeptide (TPR) repeat protein
MMAEPMAAVDDPEGPTRSAAPDSDTQADAATARRNTDGDTEIDGVVGQRRHRERVTREQFTKGKKLGRYVVEEQIGEGGMGLVLAAYDPELHRRVALKLLRPALTRGGSGTDGRARLLREAQAMAQLSHPNVIHVYDVGTVGDHVFLALEFIDGENMGQWIRRDKPAWRDVLRVFIAAGRGLAAAHAAGLIHRDFKPDNVLMGKDGRVLVTDFGLARAETDRVDDSPTPMPSPAPSSSRGSQPRLLEPLTAYGTVLGTPGYAAPEHLKGVTGDARSDQFSFAASLYAGLYCKRPFPADSWASYKQMLERGFPEPGDNKVPAWVRRALERGLSIDPAARFPAMDAFLAALGKDPAIRRKKWLIAGGVVVALGVAAGATVRAMQTGSNERAQLCKGADKKLAGVWGADQRAAIQKAFAATDRPFAQKAVALATKKLDDQARAWTAMYTENCEATRLRGEQSEQVMTVRTACLDQRLRELGELATVLGAADGKVVERAVAATSALTPLADCTDVKTLLAAVPPPSDPAKRKQVDDLRGQLARAKALHDGGKFKEAAAVATPIVEAAKQVDYRPLEAEALMRLGEAQVFMQAGEPAVETLRAATRAAEASRYDEIRARALAWMVGVIGYDLEKPNDALGLAEDARAAIERLGNPPAIAWMLESSLGRTYSGTAQYQKMYEHHLKSLELRLEVYGEDDPNTASGYNNVAAALNALGRFPEALATHRKAQAIREKLLGSEHPDNAMSVANIGNQHFQVGLMAEAVDYTERALANARQSLPLKHGTVLSAMSTRATALAELGRYQEAEAAFDELLAILRKEMPKNARTARTIAFRATYVLSRTGRAKQALAEAEEAAAIGLAAVGKDNDDYATTIEAKGHALHALGYDDKALAAFDEAIAIYEKVLGKDDPLLVDMLLATAEVYLGRNKAAQAVAALERAIAICERRKIGGKFLAKLQLALARAVSNTNPEKAKQLAAAARGWYATSPLRNDLAAIDALLASHTATRP